MNITHLLHAEALTTHRQYFLTLVPEGIGSLQMLKVSVHVSLPRTKTLVELRVSCRAP